MLNLNSEVSIDIKHVKFPVYFRHKNICIHCGGEGTLVFVDKFGRESKKELSAFEHIKCTKCGRIYSMRWEPDEKDETTYRPSAVEFNIIQDFKNLINPVVNHMGEKSLD